MIIGAEQRELVIANIQEAANAGHFQQRVEINDPSLSQEEKRRISSDYLQERNTLEYKLKNVVARGLVGLITWSQNQKTQITGMENMLGIAGGAIITSNHFNPLDNIIIRHMLRQAGKDRLYVVSQETNLAMSGVVGFLMTYADTLPISSVSGYKKKDFPQLLENILQSNQYVLIYSEQEMWFNYRKPRPLKRGAYYYAARFGVPIISCFVEMKEQVVMETARFHKVSYILHVLPPIYPQAKLTVRENSFWMLEKDYAQKKAAYEKAYHQQLDYTFRDEDIAGWVPDAVWEALALL